MFFLANINSCPLKLSKATNLSEDTLDTSVSFTGLLATSFNYL